MSDLQNTLYDSHHRLHTDLSPTAQAHLTIPFGTVRNRFQTFKSQIAHHKHEADGVLLTRSIASLDVLIRRGRTYATQLHIVELLGLSHLFLDLLNFLREHKNLYRSAIRRRQAARIAFRHDKVDVIERVQCRLQNMRIVFSLNVICGTEDESVKNRMREDGCFNREMQELNQLLETEHVRVLHRIQALTPQFGKEIELENIGPDHDIHDFGQDIQPALGQYQKSANTEGLDSEERDHTHLCCICIDKYDNVHPAFLLHRCGHILGASCFATWLNSTAPRANLCPQCRMKLCDRRRRRPRKTLDVQTKEEVDGLYQHLKVIGGLVTSISNVYAMLYGSDEFTAHFNGTVARLNARFLSEGLHFHCETVESRQDVWRLRRGVAAG
jgi:hypothetical protein